MYPGKDVWGRVRVGSYIQEHRTGTVWRVDRDNGVHVGMRNRAGEEKILKRPRHDVPVTLMFLDEDELMAMLAEQLGGVVEAVKHEGEQIFHCRPFNDLQPRDQIEHIKMMHGHHAGVAGIKGKNQLVEWHDEMHSDSSLRERWLPHVHDDRKDRW